MKKWSYIVGGFLLGVVITLSSSTVFAEVQSLVGKKVTAEMQVFVNGQALANKGAVIDGVTNAPVRSLADSLGADLQVDIAAKTINITTTNNAVSDSGTKEELMKERDKLQADLDHLIKRKAEDQASYDSMKANGRVEGEQTWINALEILDTKIKEKTEALDKINAELQK